MIVPRGPHLTDLRLSARPIIAVFAGLAVAVGAVSCASAPAPAANTEAPPAITASSTGPIDLGTVSQSASDCSLNGSKNAYRAGPVVMTATNETEDVAAFDMWRIGGNVTYDQFADYIQAERELAEAGQPGLNHPGYVTNLITIELQAGETGTMDGTVVPGTYAIVCIRMFPQVGEPRPFSSIGPLIVE